MDILLPVLILGGLGVIFGIGLSIASKKLTVAADPRLERIHGLLPGANCGACGGAGCFGFAEDLLSGKRSPDACKIADDAIKEKIASVLGETLQKKTPMTAVLHCYGGKKVGERAVYQGIEDCIAADGVQGGQKDCVWGCLGFGTCARVCPFGAIMMLPEGIPRVDEAQCRACNKCVPACPKKLFSLIPQASRVYVACSSCDSGHDTAGACPVGCIACRACEQACPVDAIHVTDDLAVIDYAKCTSCGSCVTVCPMKTIHRKA
jgi:Na+-translocating ferredoxin:NAD+ oxidoreductase RNF subunit RnfB